MFIKRRLDIHSVQCHSYGSYYTDQQAHGVGRLELAASELLHEFVDGELVMFADVVEQAEGVVLHHHIIRVHSFLRLIHPPFNHIHTSLTQVLQHRVQIQLYCRYYND